ncbi:hypothetical protein B0J14DRAFT_660650 [Halenospora varia]|nr:hypothetical protein B0J14DRAFT_660650 [Halenospora varia]
MALNSNVHLYSRETRQDRVYLTMKDRKLSMEKRFEIAIAGVVPELEIPRPLTADELESIGYTELTGNNPHYVNRPLKKGETTPKSHLHATYVSPKMTEDLGLTERLMKIQRFCLNPANIDKMVKCERRGHLRRRGWCFDGTLAVEQGNKPHGCKVCRQAQMNDPEFIEYVRLVGEAQNIIINSVAPEANGEAQFRRWCIEASLTMGIDGNYSASSYQANITLGNGTLEFSLKSKGHLHTDVNDDPTLWTVVIFLPNCPKRHYAGRFIIASSRLICPGEAFGALVFSGKTVHGAKAVAPYPDEVTDAIIDAYKACLGVHKVDRDVGLGRCNIPVYPRNNLMRARPEQLHPDLFDEAKMLPAFGGSRRAFHTWKMRVWMKKQFLDQSQDILTMSPEQVCDMFTWVNEDGVTKKPLLLIAQTALEAKGKVDPEWESLHKDLLEVGCGSGPAKKFNPTKRKASEMVGEDGEELERGRCDYLTWKSGTQCVKLGWKVAEGMFRCTLHDGIVQRSVRYGAGQVKGPCTGITSRGKPCKRKWYPENGVVLCNIHRKKQGAMEARNVRRNLAPAAASDDKEDFEDIALEESSKEDADAEESEINDDLSDAEESDEDEVDYDMLDQGEESDDADDADADGMDEDGEK